MTTTPDITIILPVLNRRHLVCRALDSIKSQGQRPLRLIVVDNGSTDDTREVVERWIAANPDEGLDISLVSYPQGGVCGARNYGLTMVDTEYVAFFDSDDIMLPNHMERITRELARHPDTDLLYFDIAIRDDDGWLITKRSNDTNTLRAHLLYSIISTLRYVVRTKLVRQIGGWNVECLRWNDLELGVRLLLQNPLVRKLHGEPTVHVYHTPQSITGSGYYDADHRCENTLAHIATLLEGPDMALPRRWVDCRRAILAAWYTREKHHDEAIRLMRALLADASLTDALKLRAIYATTRYCGHGGTMLSMWLYPTPRKPKHQRS